MAKRGSDPDKERIRRQLATELEYATIFANFMQQAQTRGYVATITVEVDGVDCQVRVLIKPNDDLFEYLANWACATKILNKGKLEEFDREGWNGERADENGAK